MHSIANRRLIYVGTITVAFLTCGGCAATDALRNAFHAEDHVNIYQPFDNSRDFGPSFLVGPPDHHFGSGARIDDSRSSPPDPAQQP